MPTKLDLCLNKRAVLGAQRLGRPIFCGNRCGRHEIMQIKNQKPLFAPSDRKQVVNSSEAQQGFTLLEILVVLAIAGILVAIAVSSFTKMLYRTHARDAAQSISTGIDWARSYAISSSRIVTYTSSPGCAWSASAGNARSSGSASMPLGVACQAANTGALYFLPDGSVTQMTSGQPAPKNTLTYTVSGGGNTWTITLAPSGISTINMTWQ